MLELSTHESVRDISEHEWSALAVGAPPFLQWCFLDAMESTGCVAPDRGWLPMHVSIRDRDRLVAVAPAYVKGNSEGEFVFDHSWARFCYEHLGKEYYPKLIVAAPFTPATGPRLLTGAEPPNEALSGAFVAALRTLMSRAKLSSVHVLFPFEKEADALERAGCLHRFGLQYHWRNAGYATFEDFLARFTSKRRNQIRREVRELATQGTVIETFTGDDISPEVVDFAYEFYLSTVNKYLWGRQYLNRAFFEEICARMPEQILVVLARDASSRRPIAGAFNLLGPTALYGRYWGAREERSCLHFNVCYYRGIDECIRRGLELFEPGAGGEHKLARGFEPTITHSAHLLGDRRFSSAIEDFLQRERVAVEGHVEEYALRPVLK
jgi:predicted N-acyltransferase